MTRLSRLATALLVLAATVSSLAGRVSEHAHAFGESDLVAHSLVTVGHEPTPGAQPHLDRAVELEHPVCADCILALVGGDRARRGESAPAAVASEATYLRSDFVGALERSTRLGPARAPPYR